MKRMSKRATALLPLHRIKCEEIFSQIVRGENKSENAWKRKLHMMKRTEKVKGAKKRVIKREGNRLS